MFTLSFMDRVPARIRRTGLLSGAGALWLGALALVLAVCAAWGTGPLSASAPTLRLAALAALLSSMGFAAWNTQRAYGRHGSAVGLGLGATAAALLGPALA